MVFEKVIKGGTVVGGGGRRVGDVGISGGKIAAVGAGLEGREEFDARGTFVIPGGIDAHVHFQLPFGGTVSSDDFENGTKAAACGGVTAVIDFAMQQRGGGLIEAVERRRQEAEGRVAVDFGLHASITDWNERTAAEVRTLVGAGVTSFKMFMIYREEGWMADDASLFRALESSRETGARIGVHAESAALLDLLTARLAADPATRALGARAHALARPGVVEWEAVGRALAWAEETGGRLHVVHVSTARGAELVGAARERGVDACCETCPQYLLLDESVFGREDGHLFATAPQIKTRADSEGLWRALAGGSASLIATDTCTFTRGQKAAWMGDFRRIPLGMPGVETMMELTYTHGPAAGRFPLERWVALVSENPARLFGLYPKKGAVAEGSDADVVVWDPRGGRTISHPELQTNCDWSPFDGWKSSGLPRLVFSRGVLVAEEGRFVGPPAHGRFLKRGLSAPPV